MLLAGRANATSIDRGAGGINANGSMPWDNAIAHLWHVDDGVTPGAPGPFSNLEANFYCSPIATKIPVFTSRSPGTRIGPGDRRPSIADVPESIDSGGDVSWFDASTERAPLRPRNALAHAAPHHTCRSAGLRRVLREPQASGR